VLVNDQPAPVYFVSAGQINFLMPYATPPGLATVRVTRDGQRGNAVSVNVVASSPRLLSLNVGTYGIAQFSDGAFAVPASTGLGRPAKNDDVLVFYAFGLGQTTPVTTDGAAAPSNPLATAPGFRIVFNPGIVPNSGVAVDPQFVGLTPGLAGLYQINVAVPSDAPRGDNIVVVLSSGSTTSNRVTIAIQ